MSMLEPKSKYHRSTGIDYYYYILRLVWGIPVFYVWSQASGLFTLDGWDLFWQLFLVMIFTGIIARIIAYLTLWIPMKLNKGFSPGMYYLNFQSKINRISLVFIAGTAICALIYAFGVDGYIIETFFPGDTLISALAGYIFIKIGAHLTAWAFLKIIT
jgi:hypothetical protein